jgi:phospholipase A1
MGEGMARCSKISDPTQRLECFDALARQTGEKPIAAQPAANQSKTVVGQVQEGNADRSILSKQWDLEHVTPNEARRIRLYRANYFMPFTYNTTPNRSEALDMDGNARAQNAEAEFQLSLKMKIWQDLLGKDIDIWFAYTQHSFWQLYNTAFSSPFRETNYEPELFFTFRTDYPFLFGLRGRLFNIGVNHQSNGRSEPLSRSWNRIVATAGFERKGLNLFLKTWYRIPESSQNDDNPDIHRYLGYGEMQGFYYLNGHRLGAMLRNNLQTHNNKGALQLDWAFPLPFMQMPLFKGYIQYFNGYGDNLLDYNKSTNKIGFGFMLADW